MNEAKVRDCLVVWLGQLWQAAGSPHSEEAFADFCNTSPAANWTSRIVNRLEDQIHSQHHTNPPTSPQGE